jgi:hypothetical protein
MPLDNRRPDAHTATRQMFCIALVIYINRLVLMIVFWLLIAGAVSTFMSRLVDIKI